jgi:hypothetical protein
MINTARKLDLARQIPIHTPQSRPRHQRRAPPTQEFPIRTRTHHRPTRVATFVAEAVNVAQMQTTTEALQRHNRRAVLISEEQALLRGTNGSSELNFAVATRSDDVEPSGYDALVLMQGADNQADTALALAKQFQAAGKPVIALTGSAGLVSSLVGNTPASETTASAIVDGQLYEVSESDADWMILNAVNDRLDRVAA